MTAPDVNADVRARFEADIVRFYGHKPGRTFDRRKDGNYKSGTVQAAWNGYYIAHADLSGEVRELVEAARYAMNNIHMVDGTAMDAVVGPTFTVYGMFLNKLHAALAKFHPTHQEKP